MLAQVFPKVTYNYRNCSLIIRAGEWIKNGNRVILPITAILSNNADDTLKYASELCFKGEFGYLTDTTKFSIAGRPEDCLKNWPITEVIPPHSNITENLLLIKKYPGTQPVQLQLMAGLAFVNLDTTMIFFATNIAKNNMNAFNRYKNHNTHIIRSNILKVR